MIDSPFDVLIILGSVRAEERKLRAIAGGYAINQKLTKNLLLTGGKTNGINEAKSMQKTILKKFPQTKKNQIFLEENSLDTSTNFQNCLPLIKSHKWKKIGVLANNYHLRRALRLAEAYGIATDGISVEDLLFKYDQKYKIEIKKYYKTNDMKNIFTFEIFLNKLLIIDPYGKIPRKLTQSYYKFIK